MNRCHHLSYVIFFALIFLFLTVKTASLNALESSKKLEINGKSRIIYQYEPVSKLTVLQLFIGAGQKMGPPGLEGISYVSTWLAIGLPDRTKINTLMNLGSTFSMQVDGDVSVITVKSLSKNFEQTLELISEVLSKPLISSIRISEIKQQMEFALESIVDDPLLTMKLTFLNAFFKTPGYAGSVYGTKESLKKIKRKDILNFLEAYFNLENITFSIATDLDEKTIRKLFERYFKNFTIGKPAAPVTVEVVDPKMKEINITGRADEVLVAYGFPVPRVSSKKQYCLAMMLEVLVGKGAGSRMWLLREDKNLAYIAETELIRLKDAGILMLYAKTASETKNQVQMELSNILSALREAGLSPEEFAVTKEYSKSEILRHAETKHSRSLFAALFEEYGLGHDFLFHIDAEIDSVTLEEMDDFIEEILDPSHQVEVTIGPEQKSNR